MDEIKETGVAEAVAEPQENVQEEIAKPDVAEVSEERQDRNWRALRHKKEQLEAEIKQRDQFIEKIMAMANQPQAQQEVVEEEEPDEEYINRGHVKKLAKKQIEPIQKEVEDLKKQLQERKQKDSLYDLRKTYSDFDTVVNSETLAILETEEPELAEVIASSQDNYKIALQAYKYIKKLGIVKEASEKSLAKEVAQNIKKNEEALPSPQAYDKRPMAQAFKMTKELEEELYNEMTGAAMLAGSVPEIS